jgi:hypothetical protein
MSGERFGEEGSISKIDRKGSGRSRQTEGLGQQPGHERRLRPRREVRPGADFYLEVAFHHIAVIKP